MNKSVFALFAIFLLVTSFQFNSTEHGDENVSTIIDAAAKARIDATLKSFVDQGKISGVSALIFEKNKEVYYNAFGYANKEAKVPMQRNTIVRIYSMTKPVTGTALMQL